MTSLLDTFAEFQPLLLSFNHVHTTTLQTYFRIFHDMEATTFDFSKVSALVRSQLRSVFALTKDIVEFDRNMFNTPYQVIRDRRLKELEWADDLLGRDAIRLDQLYISVLFSVSHIYHHVVIYVQDYQNNLTSFLKNKESVVY